LVQIWLRGADYLVPRADVGVFTLGTLPRDPHQRAALHLLAEEVLDSLEGMARPTREVAAILPHPLLLRCASATGKVHIRWDARTITVRPATPADLDEEDARLELARRYLHWLGPGDVSSFAKWAGVRLADAQRTWKVIQAEVLPVAVHGRGGWIHASDEPEITRPQPEPGGVRLLPLGDPYLWPLGGLAARLPAKVADQLLAHGASPRTVNGLGGRVLADGEIVGAWGRAGAVLTALPLSPWTDRRRAAVEAEGMAMSGPIGQTIRVRWLDHRADS
jgi:Winged helix DNA-binding domain